MADGLDFNADSGGFAGFDAAGDGSVDFSFGGFGDATTGGSTESKGKGQSSKGILDTPSFGLGDFGTDFDKTGAFQDSAPSFSLEDSTPAATNMFANNSTGKSGGGASKKASTGFGTDFNFEGFQKNGAESTFDASVVGLALDGDKTTASFAPAPETSKKDGATVLPPKGTLKKTPSIMSGIQSRRDRSGADMFGNLGGGGDGNDIGIGISAESNATDFTGNFAASGGSLAFDMKEADALDGSKNSDVGLSADGTDKDFSDNLKLSGGAIDFSTSGAADASFFGGSKDDGAASFDPRAALRGVRAGIDGDTPSSSKRTERVAASKGSVKLLAEEDDIKAESSIDANLIISKWHKELRIRAMGILEDSDAYVEQHRSLGRLEAQVSDVERTIEKFKVREKRVVETIAHVEDRQTKMTETLGRVQRGLRELAASEKVGLRADAFDRSKVYRSAGDVAKELESIVAQLSRMIERLNAGGGDGVLGSVISIMNEHDAALKTMTRELSVLRRRRGG